MIYEKRTYRMHPGKAGEFLKIYEEAGLGIIARYAKLIGCWTSESGTLNEVVFIWAYEDYGHRQSQRAKLAADQEWQAFVPSILPYLAHQESQFMLPAGLSPLQ
jgi:hypothetical protein